MSSPPTRCAHSGEASIAHQTLGDGPCDLVLDDAVAGIPVHIASRLMHEAASGRSWWRRYALER